MKTKLEHIETELRPVYGGNQVLIEYFLTTSNNGFKNEYKVWAEVRGIATGDVYINFFTYEPLTNNEETLTEEGVQDLLGW